MEITDVFDESKKYNKAESCVWNSTYVSSGYRISDNEKKESTIKVTIYQIDKLNCCQTWSSLHGVFVCSFQAGKCTDWALNAQYCIPFILTKMIEKKTIFKNQNWTNLLKNDYQKMIFIVLWFCLFRNQYLNYFYLFFYFFFKQKYYCNQ